MSYQNTHVKEWVGCKSATHCIHFQILSECLMVNSGFSYSLFIYLLIHSYAKSFCSGLDESVLEECLQYLEKQLENSQVRKAMEEFFSFGYLFI